MHDLVDERVAEARHLLPGGRGLHADVAVGAPHRGEGLHGAVRRGVDADHVAVLGLEVRDRDLERDRADVVARDRVNAAADVARADVGAARLVEVDEVEDHSDVPEERVVGLAGEALQAARQRLDRLLAEVRVARDALRAGVVRRRHPVARDAPGGHHPGGVPRVAEDAVELLHEHVARGARVQVAGRGRLRSARDELVPVAHVPLAVAGLVNVEVVPGGVREEIEVRAAVGLLERDPVADDRHRVRSIRAPEGVQVGVVCGGILEERRGLPVA